MQSMPYQVLIISFGICTIGYISIGAMGYLMFGENVLSQLSLNLPTNRIGLNIAIYTILIIPIAKFALIMPPLAAAIESHLFVHYRTRPISILLRTLLLISAVLVDRSHYQAYSRGNFNWSSGDLFSSDEANEGSVHALKLNALKQNPSFSPGVPFPPPSSAFEDPSKLSAYRDRRFPGSQEEFEIALQTSMTVYVGNMSFYTTEEQVYELFSRAGEIKKMIMGLDKNSKTPCGFCFVLYYSREDTEDAVKYISGTILDDRPIRVDFDWGFQEGRQWGRGRSGGQVRDEYRTDYDPDILFCFRHYSVCMS
ncbi:hypothetical protein FEM48_Zijuj02G0090100 [Ziziphus jujuba var. spinosa]|uniref:RRM domain-containing protein n=1 Tax=Ziziphus jujuba var. spinosa TaxID=714518 RepID=A0A978VUU5_ZIZJJ|nr:hypothetical protein FEM48_Zijuj02G0090100 [Ziziphus jujuba var. spinosa]